MSLNNVSSVTSGGFLFDLPKIGDYLFSVFVPEGIAVFQPRKIFAYKMIGGVLTQASPNYISISTNAIRLKTDGTYLYIQTDTGGRNQLLAYSFDGTNFTLIDTLLMPLNYGISSFSVKNGKICIATDGFAPYSMIVYNFNGSNFSYVTSGTIPNSVSYGYPGGGNIGEGDSYVYLTTYTLSALGNYVTTLHAYTVDISAASIVDSGKTFVVSGYYADADVSLIEKNGIVYLKASNDPGLGTWLGKLYSISVSGAFTQLYDYDIIYPTTLTHNDTFLYFTTYNGISGITYFNAYQFGVGGSLLSSSPIAMPNINYSLNCDNDYVYLTNSIVTYISGSDFYISGRFDVDSFIDPRYWISVGDTDFFNISNWSVNSSGASGAPVPTSTNPVYYDDGSSTDCILTASAEFKSIALSANYTGHFNTSGHDVVAFGDCLFDSTGRVTLSGCKLTVVGPGQIFFGNSMTLNTNSLKLDFQDDNTLQCPAGGLYISELSASYSGKTFVYTGFLDISNKLTVGAGTFSSNDEMDIEVGDGNTTPLSIDPAATLISLDGSPHRMKISNDSPLTINLSPIITNSSSSFHFRFEKYGGTGNLIISATGPIHFGPGGNFIFLNSIANTTATFDTNGYDIYSGGVMSVGTFHSSAVAIMNCGNSNIQCENSYRGLTNDRGIFYVNFQNSQWTISGDFDWGRHTIVDIGTSAILNIPTNDTDIVKNIKGTGKSFPYTIITPGAAITAINIISGATFDRLKLNAAGLYTFMSGSTIIFNNYVSGDWDNVTLQSNTSGTRCYFQASSGTFTTGTTYRDIDNTSGYTISAYIQNGNINNGDNFNILFLTHTSDRYNIGTDWHDTGSWSEYPDGTPDRALTASIPTSENDVYWDSGSKHCTANLDIYCKSLNALLTNSHRLVLNGLHSYIGDITWRSGGLYPDGEIYVTGTNLTISANIGMGYADETWYLNNTLTANFGDGVIYNLVTNGSYHINFTENFQVLNTYTIRDNPTITFKTSGEYKFDSVDWVGKDISLRATLQTDTPTGRATVEFLNAVDNVVGDIKYVSLKNLTTPSNEKHNGTVINGIRTLIVNGNLDNGNNNRFIFLTPLIQDIQFYTSRDKYKGLI